jgi:hypothetical protein
MNDLCGKVAFTGLRRGLLVDEAGFGGLIWDAFLKPGFVRGTVFSVDDCQSVATGCPLQSFGKINYPLKRRNRL